MNETKNRHNQLKKIADDAWEREVSHLKILYAEELPERGAIYYKESAARRAGDIKGHWSLLKMMIKISEGYETESGNKSTEEEDKNTEIEKLMRKNKAKMKKAMNEGNKEKED